jgi:hypothetical protein
LPHETLFLQGQVWRATIRGPTVFAGYLDDATLTRQMLRDGWFYPGGARPGHRRAAAGDFRRVAFYPVAGDPAERDRQDPPRCHSRRW